MNKRELTILKEIDFDLSVALKDTTMSPEDEAIVRQAWRKVIGLIESKKCTKWTW